MFVVLHDLFFPSQKFCLKIFINNLGLDELKDNIDGSIIL